MRLFSLSGFTLWQMSSDPHSWRYAFGSFGWQKCVSVATIADSHILTTWTNLLIVFPLLWPHRIAWYMPIITALVGLLLTNALAYVLDTVYKSLSDTASNMRFRPVTFSKQTDVEDEEGKNQYMLIKYLSKGNVLVFTKQIKIRSFEFSPYRCTKRKISLDKS